MKFPAGKEETCSHNASYHQDHLDSFRLVTFFWFGSSNILQQYIKYPKSSVAISVVKIRHFFRYANCQFLSFLFSKNTFL